MSGVEKLNTPLTLCGKVFIPELIEHLNQLLEETPAITQTTQARFLCEQLGWYSPNGKPSLSSAKVALSKLRKRGLLGERKPTSSSEGKRGHRLRRSPLPLPPLDNVPSKAGKVRGLHLHLLSGQEDQLHGVWNDLIIEQHPCGDSPLVGAQLRYLIGSEHGWLGAFGFGPAAYVLGAREQWIGWSSPARLSNLKRVVGLSRFLIRKEVRCANLASRALSMAMSVLPNDWQERYGIRPLLVETFIDRDRFSGCCFGAANWLRIGASKGRGRLGPVEPTTSLKDIWVYPLNPQARRELQKESPKPVTPRNLVSFMAQEEWCALELAGLELGDKRLPRRAEAILEARWKQPQASFYGSFENWGQAKGAYGFIEHKKAPISMATLLEPHRQATLSRMAAEPLVLVAQDTTSLNFKGLHATSGLGPLGEAGTRGLWLHSLLACRPDAVPLGVLDANCWGRPCQPDKDTRARNAKSIDEKESLRWLQGLRTGAQAALRMPQTKVVVISDREGDLYELHDAVKLGPPNLHTLIRANHDRNLECHQKLWAFMAALPAGGTRAIAIPRRRGQGAREATLEIRWSPITIQAPKTGAKKGWPALELWAIWVHEPYPPQGIDPIDWMLLSDMEPTNQEQAWEMVQWYRCRWGIEEWHRTIKTGCAAEAREFKSAEHLQRVLAFDLIIAWRILACIKLGRALPQLPARTLYTEDELEVLWAIQKKNGQCQPTSPWQKPTGGWHAWAAIWEGSVMENQAQRV